MSEEKELQEPDFEEGSDLANFVELADLGEFDSANNLEMFGDLGDLADLGDVPDLTEVEEPVASSVAREDVGLPEMAVSEEEADIPMPDLDISVPEMTEENQDEEALLSELLGDSDMPIPDSFEEIPDMDLPELSEEAPALDLQDDIKDTGEEIVPDLSDFNGDVLFDTVEPASDVPDIFESSEELDDMFAEGKDELEIPDMAEEPEAAEDSAAFALDADAGVDESLLSALDELGESGEEMSETDILGGLDLDFSAEEESAEEEPMAMDGNGDGGIDSMLGGLLNDLDLNGAIDDSAATDDFGSEAGDFMGMDNNPFDDEGTGDGDLQDMLDVSDMIPDEVENEEKKPGFMKKVFGNIVTDEIAEEERQAAQREEEEAAKRAEEEAKEKEEAEARKEEKKAEKEAKKAEKKKEKEAQKAEKAAKKAEKKAQREEEEAAELEVVGKLNKVGVSIIVAATIVFLLVEIGGTNLFSYASTKREAVNYFKMGKYTEAYQEAIGSDMREKDEEEYSKIKVVMKVQQSLNAYQNYDRIKYYPEALDALLRGLKRYDANIEEATELEVEGDMMSCRRQILTLLREEFNLSEAQAYSIISLDKEAYQKRVVELGLDKH